MLLSNSCIFFLIKRTWSLLILPFELFCSLCWKLSMFCVHLYLYFILLSPSFLVLQSIFSPLLSSSLFVLFFLLSFSPYIYIFSPHVLACLHHHHLMLRASTVTSCLLFIALLHTLWCYFMFLLIAMLLLCAFACCFMFLASYFALLI